MSRSKVLLYSIIKYFELGLMAIVLLHFAKEAGPTSYGELSFFLVLISYSAFAVFGINASYVKHHSIEKNSSKRNKLTVFNFWFNFIMGILVFATILYFIPGESAFSLALICFLNLIRGSIQSICRSELMVWKLSFFNAFFAVSYLGCYYFGVVEIAQFKAQYFLFYWAASLCMANIVGVVLILPWLLSIKNYSISFIQDNFSKLLKNSAALFTINFGNTILLSSDRFLLNTFSVPLDTIGYYQFADSIAMIFYLGSNSLLFLLVPLYMRKLSEGETTIEEFKKTFKRIGLLWLVPMFGFMIIAIAAINFIFVDYMPSLSITVMLIFAKFLCLLTFIPTTILTTFHYESQLIKKYYLLIIPMLIIQMVIIMEAIDKVWLLPLVSISGVLLILLSLWRVNPQEDKTIVP